MSSSEQDNSASAASQGGTGSAEDRATTFQAVKGNEPQHYSGEILLVSAYALVWAILLGWVAFVWRRQRGLDERLSDLERVIGSSGSSGSDGSNGRGGGDK
ncbi:MAG: CcmD family protein [Polyangiaceae bacterium]